MDALHRRGGATNGMIWMSVIALAFIACMLALAAWLSFNVA